MRIAHDIDNDAGIAVPASLVTYLNKDAVKHAKHRSVRGQMGFSSIERGQYREYSGLLSWLKRRYYPEHTSSRRRFVKDPRKRPRIKASSEARGKRVHRQLGEYIFDQTRAGKRRRKRNGARKIKQDILTAGALRFWKAKGHTLLAAELPVMLRRIDRMTPADIITMNAAGQLYMWEVKTCGVALTKAKGTFSAPYDTVPCSPVNQWELQRHFTHEALVAEGLPLVASRVLHVYETRNGTVCVKARPVPKWLRVESDGKNTHSSSV